MSRTLRGNHPSWRAHALAHDAPIPGALLASGPYLRWRAQERRERLSPVVLDGKALTRRDRFDDVPRRLLRRRRAQLMRVGKYDQAGPDKGLWRDL